MNSPAQFTVNHKQFLQPMKQQQSAELQKYNDRLVTLSNCRHTVQSLDGLR